MNSICWTACGTSPHLPLLPPRARLRRPTLHRRSPLRFRPWPYGLQPASPLQPAAAAAGTLAAGPWLHCTATPSFHHVRRGGGRARRHRLRRLRGVAAARRALPLRNVPQLRPVRALPHRRGGQPRAAGVVVRRPAALGGAPRRAGAPVFACPQADRRHTGLVAARQPRRLYAPGRGVRHLQQLHQCVPGRAAAARSRGAQRRG